MIKCPSHTVDNDEWAQSRSGLFHQAPSIMVMRGGGLLCVGWVANVEMGSHAAMHKACCRRACIVCIDQVAAGE